jgi:hypothetical protein
VKRRSSNYWPGQHAGCRIRNLDRSCSDQLRHWFMHNESGWGFSIEVDKAAETRLEDLIGLRINIELL